jgi:hypothetical protein
MASLLEDEASASPPADAGLLGVGDGWGDALGHLYSAVKRSLTPEPTPLWPLDSPVGTERVGGDVSAGMPDPNVSPVVGLLGGRPVTAAAHQRALDLASTMAQFGPADIGAIRAFHGSPHAFDAFDPAKIGTGEGAQAYGHGLYFAENEGVARSYRDKLAASARTVDALSPDGLAEYRSRLDDAYHDLAAEHGISADAARSMDKDGSVSNYVLQGMPDQHFQNTSTGHMYQVNLAADPEQFLHWDQTVGTHPPAVRDKLLDLGYGDTHRGKDIYMHMSRGPNGDERASAKLRDAGIPGIRYLDQGSRGAGEGTHNYVVFDPATIDIIRRYGIGALIAGGGAATAASGGNGQDQAQ